MPASSIRLSHFNCTIQELKQAKDAQRLYVGCRFQLHHTGIKTKAFGTQSKKSWNFNCTIQELKQRDMNLPSTAESRFQLHHTGIKTPLLVCRIQSSDTNFNCTIQELKLRSSYAAFRAAIHFNCTIQELKPQAKKKQRTAWSISIAPYRN